MTYLIHLLESQFLGSKLLGLLPVLLLALVGAAAITAVSAKLLMPLLQRYALARPNARSSHTIPTPQGGGIAILIAMAATGALMVAMEFLPFSNSMLGLLLAALALGLLGGWDDIRPLPALLRLFVQGIVVAGILMSLPLVRILPWPHFVRIPEWFEWLNFTILVLAGVWFVNLTNFMDGLDWLTVAGFVPLTAFLALLGIWTIIDPVPAIIAAMICGALIGFAPLNRPVARLFLGDVGSLPIGLIVGWLLYLLAGTAPGNINGGMTAALLLPLYHITDATLTLFQRLKRREPIWQAHRTHAYQRAIDNGFRAMSVAGHVLGLNLVLCALAITCLSYQELGVNLFCLGLGLGLTLLLIRHFTTARTTRKLAT